MALKIEMGGIYFRRGDIVRIVIKTSEKAGHEQQENRPAVIVQNDVSNRLLATTIVVPITDASHIKKLGPNHVFLKAKVDGVDINSVVLCNQIMTIDIGKRISAKTGCLSTEKMSEIDTAIKATLGIET